MLNSRMSMKIVYSLKIFVDHTLKPPRNVLQSLGKKLQKKTSYGAPKVTQSQASYIEATLQPFN